MTPSEQIRAIKSDFDRIKEASGKEKEPILCSIECSPSGRALRLLLDPSVVLHIDKKSFEKENNLLPNHYFSDIFALVGYLRTRPALTKQDVADVKAFIASLDEDVRVFTCKFLQKSLKIGVTHKTLNKCFKTEKIETVSCMLANKYFEHADAVVGETFAITEKLDGIRCLAVCRSGERPVLLSRQGKVITGLKDIESELAVLQRRKSAEFVLDGELLIRDRDHVKSKDQYKRTMKIVQSNLPSKPGICFNAFDFIPMHEFDSRQGVLPYHLRRRQLDMLLSTTHTVIPVPILYLGSDTTMIKKLVDEQRAMGHEGVMINLFYAPYSFKRTSNLLKVKVMQDADLKIIGLKEGEGKFAGTLGALIVDYKGNPVGVGSGLHDSLRNQIWKNPEYYIGRVAKIRYFEETLDKDGVPSIRFPVFDEMREYGKEVSYN